MPLFVNIDDYWHLWDQEHMRLEDLTPGFWNIDENSPEWARAEVHEFDSWYDLYVRTNFNPLRSNYKERCPWLDPDGYFWQGDAHEVSAEYICELVYDKKFDIGRAANFLVDLGWVKLSDTLMWQYYCEYGMYRDITLAQERAMFKWCEYHNINPKDFLEA